MSMAPLLTRRGNRDERKMGRAREERRRKKQRKQKIEHVRKPCN